MMSLWSSIIGLGSLYTVAAWNAPVVELPYATYRGSYNETTGLNTFLAVRKTPTGGLTVHAQQPDDVTNQGIINATTWPSQCVQRNNQTKDISSEDCLFVNVYGPPDAQDLPVFFWIHGGGWNQFGSRQNDPTGMLNVANNSFIAVIIQYRLGAFGFLSSNQMIPGKGLNSGITDARFALQWTKDHIAAFGGDPEHITIGGESAGGGTVLQLLAAEDGVNPPLFQDAHMSSPYLPPLGFCNDTFRQEQFHNFSRDANCTDDLDCLRQAPTELLQELNWQYDLVDSFSSIGPWVPCQEDQNGYITRNPAEAIYREHLAGGKIISGNNVRDGWPFVPATLNNDTSESFFRQFLTSFWPISEDQASEVAALYPASDFGSGVARGGQVFTDAVFACPVDWLYRQFGDQQYRWLYAVKNAPHGADNGVFFAPPGPPPFDSSTILSTFVGSITSFVTDKEPNSRPRDGPEWPVHGTSYVGPYMVFNISTGTNISNSYISIDTSNFVLGRQERCDWWGKTRSGGGW